MQASAASPLTSFVHHYQANYLDDTWIFDCSEQKWKQIEFPVNAQKPRCVVYTDANERAR